MKKPTDNFFLQKYTICFNDLYQKQRKKSTLKETLVLDELSVHIMLSMD